MSYLSSQKVTTFWSYPLVVKQIFQGYWKQLYLRKKVSLVPWPQLKYSRRRCPLVITQFKSLTLLFFDDFNLNFKTSFFWFIHKNAVKNTTSKQKSNQSETKHLQSWIILFVHPSIASEPNKTWLPKGKTRKK